MCHVHCNKVLDRQALYVMWRKHSWHLWIYFAVRFKEHQTRISVVILTNVACAYCIEKPVENFDIYGSGYLKKLGHKKKKDAVRVNQDSKARSVWPS